MGKCRNSWYFEIENPRSPLQKSSSSLMDSLFCRKKPKQNVGFAEQKHLTPFSSSSTRIAEF